MTIPKEQRLQNFLMFQKKHTHGWAIFLLVFLFSSCNPQLFLRVTSPESIDFEWSSTLKPTAQTILQRFNGLNENYATSIFDQASLEQGLKSFGFKPNSISTQDFSSLSISASMVHTNQLPKDLLMVQSNSLKVLLSPSIILELFTQTGQENSNYLDLLMAPIFTGEHMSPEEYQDLIAAAYGKTLASELKSSIFKFKIELPSTIRQYEIPEAGNIEINEKTVILSFPIDFLLSLNTPISLNLYW